MFGNDMFRDEVSPAQNALNQNLFEDQQQQLEGEVRLCPRWVTRACATSTDAQQRTGRSSAHQRCAQKALWLAK